MALYILNLDDCRIDDHPEGYGKTSEGHEICGQANLPHDNKSGENSKGERHRDDQSAPDISEKEIKDDNDKNGSFSQRSCNRLDALFDKVRPVIERLDL